MKMIRGIQVLLILSITLSLGTAFSPPSGLIVNQVQSETLQGLNDLDAVMQDLERFIKEKDDHKTRSAFHRARRVYKQHEYILEYFHHSVIKKKINGAPLPQIEPKVADLNVLPPRGFQRMEELVYDEFTDWSEMTLLVKKFRDELNPLTLYQERIQLYDRHILEAIRYELIRIYTLGLTGFENPVSDSSLRECLVAFQALKAPSLDYAQRVSEDKRDKIHSLFERGESMIRSSSFEDFDRMAFLREVSDPLFSELLNIHLALGIETHEEVNTAPIATNYIASSLFDINLLNKDYFLKYRTDKISKAEVELGRTLFFDPALSYNNSLSCRSCHHPDKAFSDGQPKSISNNKKESVDRNAPTLVNALFSGAYFHDLRAGRLDMQTEHVMVNPKEFNVRPEVLAEKLRGSEGYISLFQKAFPGLKEPIQPRTIKRSLAAYVATLVSWDSPFDRYARKESEEMSPSAINGYNIFMGKAACGTCHFAPNFNGIVPPFYDDTESEVLGVTKTNDTLTPELDADPGRYDNGIQSEHAEHFLLSIKTPTIRNVGLTAPYFHNGAYPTLNEVMWFYNKGGGQGLGLEVENQTLPPDQLELTQKEIKDVIAFMESLTDIESFNQESPELPDFETIPALQNRTANAY